MAESGWLRRKLSLCLFFLIVSAASATALEWNYLVPNPAYSRDLAMGTSTIACFYAPQSTSINPAGFSFLNTKLSGRKFSLLFDPGGTRHVSSYFDKLPQDRSVAQQATDATRLMIHGAVLQWKIMTMAVLLSEPVMVQKDTVRYEKLGDFAPLELHQNRVLLAINLHPRVAIGGQIARYYHGSHAIDDGYSYGVILRPRRINVGVQYQKYPASGPYAWHPLDRRSDASTSAGISLAEEDLTISLQVMNLTQSSKPAFLEPHAGLEWRPMRAVALRAGGVMFSRSPRWAWTTGIGLLDANWFRKRISRLVVPDDILQVALAVIYNRGTPELGIGSLTLAWRL
jgi:hypothetical protein